MKTKKKQNKFVRYILVPFKILRKANMKAMFDCAHQVGQAGNTVSFTVPLQQLPARSFNNVSINNHGFKHEDSTRLLRVLSTKNGGDMLERSYSIGVGKLGTIDEDELCDLKEVHDDNKKVGLWKNNSVY